MNMSEDTKEKEEEIKSLDDLKKAGALEEAVKELAQAEDITLEKIDPKTIEGLDKFETDCLDDRDWVPETTKKITEFMRSVGKATIPYYFDEEKDIVLLDVDKKKKLGIWC